MTWGFSPGAVVVSDFNGTRGTMSVMLAPRPGMQVISSRYPRLRPDELGLVLALDMRWGYPEVMVLASSGHMGWARVHHVRQVSP